MPLNPLRIPYGADPEQYAELTLPVKSHDDDGCGSAGSPTSGSAPTSGHAGSPTSGSSPTVVVIIHGGYWRSRYSAHLGRPAALDLARRGYACWNLEYRRSGNGGGWPETFEDISAGIDALEAAAGKYGLDLSSVTVLGHSAGGQLAVWAAGRRNAAVPVTAVVSQAGVLNLAEALELNLSDGAVRSFLGSSPEGDPDRYRSADPMQRLPLPVPVIALHGYADSHVPLSQSAGFVHAAKDSGSAAELRMVPGDHFDLITPGTPAWAAVIDAVAEASQVSRS